MLNSSYFRVYSKNILERIARAKTQILSLQKIKKKEKINELWLKYSARNNSSQYRLSLDWFGRVWNAIFNIKDPQFHTDIDSWYQAQVDYGYTKRYGCNTDYGDIIEAGEFEKKFLSDISDLEICIKNNTKTYFYIESEIYHKILKYSE